MRARRPVQRKTLMRALLIVVAFVASLAVVPALAGEKRYVVVTPDSPTEFTLWTSYTASVNCARALLAGRDERSDDQHDDRHGAHVGFPLHRVARSHSRWSPDCYHSGHDDLSERTAGRRRSDRGHSRPGSSAVVTLRPGSASAMPGIQSRP